MSLTILTRRRFVQQVGGAALGTLVSTLGDLYRLAAAAPSSDDYKALVCIFLYGGNDSLSTVLPGAGAAYDSYAQARGPLALPASDLLPITPQSPQPVALALAPQLPELAALFAQKKLAIVHNVGPLLAPTTRGQYEAGSVPVPPSLFAHDEQQKHWQTSYTNNAPALTGWGGRMADLLYSLNSNAKISLSVSLGGTNCLQIGNQVVQYQVSPWGTFRLAGYDPSWNNPLTNAMQRIFAQTPHNLLEATWNHKMRNAILGEEQLTAALETTPDLNTPFPGNPLSDQLRMIARIISARELLGVKRQIFFAALGSFDTHGGQQRDHPVLLTALSQAMHAFYTATVELGVEQQVTTFTASEFGRTLKHNGEGTDHGWGGDHFVLGGSVQGGECYGTYPTIALDGPDDAGSEGRWIPTIAVDEYAATFAQWFGVTTSDIPLVVPNIGRFAQQNLAFFL